MAQAIKTIIFDLGGVLLDWNPLYVYDDTYFESQEKETIFLQGCVPANGMKSRMPAGPLAKAPKN